MKNGTLSDDGEGNGAGSNLFQPAEFIHNNSSTVNTGNTTVIAPSVAPVTRNCTARIRTYCNRETLHFRFWPGIFFDCEEQIFIFPMASAANGGMS
jgi:hypothetical protein